VSSGSTESVIYRCPSCYGDKLDLIPISDNEFYTLVHTRTWSRIQKRIVITGIDNICNAASDSFVFIRLLGLFFVLRDPVVNL
jgi:hypothetical protein